MATKRELENQLAASETEIQQIQKVLGHLKIVQPITYYKEKKLEKFNGEGDVIEWTTEVLDYVNTRFQDEAVKVDFIIDHLEGKARENVEVDCIKMTFPGQIAVAIARATRKDGLRVLNFSSSVPKPAKTITQFHQRQNFEHTFSCCHDTVPEKQSASWTN
jgi:hypothetical protein